MEGRQIAMIAGGVATFIAVLLILILVPLNFSYVERQTMAFKKNTITNDVDQSAVHFPGTHSWGPGHGPVSFPTTWQFVQFTESNGNALTVFTDVGQITVELSFYYRLQQQTLSTLYSNFGLAYHSRIVSIAQAELRNAATQFTTDNYQQNRSWVADSFYSALAAKLPGVATVAVSRNHFFFGRVELPTSVLSKRQQVFVNTQLITTQEYNYTAQQTRIDTLANVTSIRSQVAIVLQNATLVAGRLRTNAGADQFAAVQKESGTQVVKIISALGIVRANVTDHFLKYNALLDSPNNITLLSGLTAAVIGSESSGMP